MELYLFLKAKNQGKAYKDSYTWFVYEERRKEKCLEKNR